MRQPRGRLLPLALLLCLSGPFGRTAQGSAHPAVPRRPQNPAALQAVFPGRDPSLRWDGGGSLHLLYVEDRPAGAAVLYRRLGSEPAGPFAVSPPGLYTAARTESPPILALLPDGTLVTAYPVPLPGKWQSEIVVQRSTDRGKTWSAPKRLHAEGPGAHSFLSAAVSASGDLVFAWLDSRAGHMGLYETSTRDGAAFEPDRSLDPLTCQCCGTGLLAGRGPDVWLVYRDLETEEVRDFKLLRSRTSPPVFEALAKLSDDRWTIQGCPETGARLIEAADGALWAAWFTGGGQAGVYVSRSDDGGATFAARTLLSDPELLGRHPEIGLLPDGRVAVLFQTTEEDGSTPVVVRLREAGPGSGGWGSARRLAPSGAYPRLAIGGGRAAVAFTCRQGEKTSVFVADWSLLESGKPQWGPCAPSMSRP